jgi:hypothetical protein
MTALRGVSRPSGSSAGADSGLGEVEAADVASCAPERAAKATNKMTAKIRAVVVFDRLARPECLDSAFRCAESIKRLPARRSAFGAVHPSHVSAIWSKGRIFSQGASVNSRPHRAFAKSKPVPSLKQYVVFVESFPANRRSNLADAHSLTEWALLCKALRSRRRKG